MIKIKWPARLIIIKSVSLICLALLLSTNLFLSGVRVRAAGVKLTNSKGLSVKESLFNFTEAIYDHYSRQDFKYIYQNLHPALQQKLSEEKYCQFQEKNFRRYGVDISDVQIENYRRVGEIPKEFLDYLNQAEHNSIYAVAIRYQLKFNSNGLRQEKILEKEVLIYRQEGQHYLLWDPAIIDKG